MYPSPPPTEPAGPAASDATDSAQGPSSSPDQRPDGGTVRSGHSTRLDPGKGMWPAVVAGVLGVLGCVLLLTPFDITGVRGFIALVFAVPGVAVGVIAWFGRRGWLLAVVGTILSVIALGIGGYLLTSPGKDPNAKIAPDDQTKEILRDDLDVRLGELHNDPEEGPSVTVTVHNKGSDVATFDVTFEQSADGGPCETGLSAHDLLPGASYQAEVDGCATETSTQDWSLQLTKVTKN